jgi:hemolysin III
MNARVPGGPAGIAVAGASVGVSVERPLLRGVLHRYAFVAALAGGTVLVVGAPGIEPRLAGAIFVAAVTVMFGASALYHWVEWALERGRMLRRLDRAAIYVCIAGSYTAYALLALGGAWRIAFLAAIWGGGAVAVLAKLVWLDAPRWVQVAIAVALGWAGLATIPEALSEIGPAAVGLALGGGLLYTVGGVVYALRRPDPVPAVFGFHEVFHAFVIGAVACHYGVFALAVGS